MMYNFITHLYLNPINEKLKHNKNGI